MSDIDDVTKLKVAELRSELQSRGLSTAGVKAVLVDRLRAALEAEKDANVEAEANASEEREIEDEPVAEPEPAEEPVETQEQNGQEEEEIAAEVSDVQVKQEEEEEEDGKKLDYEDAPMEELGDVKEEALEKENAVVKEEPTAEVKQETENVEVKTESASPEKEDKRGTKRSHSDQHHDNKRSRPDVEEVRVEDEPDFDKSVMALDWYNSDISLQIDRETRLSASPLVVGGFAYVWHGARATFGIKTGKVFYEVKVEDHLNVGHIEKDEQHPHVVRCGWSVDATQLILGEEPLSYGYGGTAKASTDLKFKDYGKKYGKGDVIGCFLDMDSSPMTMSFTVNGENQGVCYTINGKDLDGAPLFPHVLTKNSSFKMNFGASDPWFEPMVGYTAIGKVDPELYYTGTQGPEKREDAEVIMMVGLPAAGKTVWVEKYTKEHPDKKFNVLGTNNLIDRMKVMGLPRKRNYAGRWENLIEKCTKCLNKMLYIATKRRRNFIIDQTNVFPSAQKRKIKGFVGYKRRAVVIFPTDEALKERTKKREKEEGKDVPDKAILEMKANFKLPEVGEFFEEVDFIELQREECTDLLKQYNKEGEKAGYGPKNFNSGGGHNQQGGRRVPYIDRRGKYNNRGGGGYRGGWDRDRDRRGGFDRRDRGSWNRDRDRDRNSRDNRSGGGYNRDRRGGGGGGWSGGFKGNNQNKQGGGGGGSWGNQGGNQDYNNQGWNQQSYGNQGGWGGNQGYNQGYNWNQQYYGQQTQPQQQQQYWGQNYAGYNNQTQGYGQTGGYGQNNYYGNTQQVSQQPQWGGYGQQNYGSNTGYNTQNQQYRK